MPSGGLLKHFSKCYSSHVRFAASQKNWPLDPRMFSSLKDRSHESERVAAVVAESGTVQRLRVSPLVSGARPSHMAGNRCGYCVAGGRRPALYPAVLSDFARCFWRSGAHMSFQVPSVTYPRVNSAGEVIHVTRKPFTRRTIKADVWKYHLRQMAASEDPVDYLCRFLPAADQMSRQARDGDGAKSARAQVAVIGQPRGA